MTKPTCKRKIDRVKPQKCFLNSPRIQGVKVISHLFDMAFNKSLFFTDRVLSTRREVIVSLCLSVHTYRGGGVPEPGPGGEGGARARSSQGGTPIGGTLGTPVRPGWGTLRGYPNGGYPGYPHQTWKGEYPNGGYPRYPCQTWMGVPRRGGGYPRYPLSDLGGYSNWGVPQITPPSDLDGGVP